MVLSLKNAVEHLPPGDFAVTGIWWAKKRFCLAAAGRAAVGRADWGGTARSGAAGNFSEGGTPDSEAEFGVPLRIGKD